MHNNINNEWSLFDEWKGIEDKPTIKSLLGWAFCWSKWIIFQKIDMLLRVNFKVKLWWNFSNFWNFPKNSIIVNPSWWFNWNFHFTSMLIMRLLIMKLMAQKRQLNKMLMNGKEISLYFSPFYCLFHWLNRIQFLVIQLAFNERKLDTKVIISWSHTHIHSEHGKLMKFFLLLCLQNAWSSSWSIFTYNVSIVYFFGCLFLYRFWFSLIVNFVQFSQVEM